MARKTLGDVLTPKDDSVQTLRWEVVVPIGTNLFVLVELFLFAFVGAAVTILLLCSGAWFTEGCVTMSQLVAAFTIGGMILGGGIVLFIAIAIIFFGNRYYAIYRMDAEGLYHEGSRGHDESGECISLHCKPYPVRGVVTPACTRAKQMLWGKVDRFQAIPSMRTVILRRRFWHFHRLYMPDADTHKKVTDFLAERLTEVGGLARKNNSKP